MAESKALQFFKQREHLAFLVGASIENLFGNSAFKGLSAKASFSGRDPNFKYQEQPAILWQWGERASVIFHNERVSNVDGSRTVIHDAIPIGKPKKISSGTTKISSGKSGGTVKVGTVSKTEKGTTDQHTVGVKAGFELTVGTGDGAPVKVEGKVSAEVGYEFQKAMSFIEGQEISTEVEIDAKPDESVSVATDAEMGRYRQTIDLFGRYDAGIVIKSDNDFEYKFDSIGNFLKTIRGIAITGDMTEVTAYNPQQEVADTIEGSIPTIDWSETRILEANTNKNIVIS